MNHSTLSQSSKNTEAVPQHLIPKRTLPNGDKMPAIGLGTFGSDHVSGEQVAEAIIGAAAVGYRHFDCASVYGNEALIGTALQKIIQSGIPRSELWINSKLWNDKHDEKDVIPACKQSLQDLQLEYLDLYFVHWPFPNSHPPGCTVTARSLSSRAYNHTEFMKTWRQMEKLVDLGLVRHLGTSNMTIAKLKPLLKEARIKPVCNQMEIHPHFQQPELFKFIVDQGMIPIGYSPVGSPARPERDRTPEDTVDIEDPVILEIAKKHGVHPAVICVKWAEQRGQVPIPFSVNPRNFTANLKAMVSTPLSDEEMQKIAKTDRNCRLIKGQVFLWKENQNWEDLWDLNGEITPA